MGMTGWPAASSRSTTRPLGRSIATGNCSGRPWRTRRAMVASRPSSVCSGAHRSTILPASSITVTSCVVLAQSHPTNIGGSSTRWRARSLGVEARAAGVSLFGPCCGRVPEAGLRVSERPGVAELKLAVWRLGNEAIPRTPTEEHDPLHADRGRNTRPMRQRMMSEAADDVLAGLALGGAPGGVVAGRLVPAQPHDHDAVQRGVGLAVAAPVQAMAAGLARGGLHRRAAAQRGERGLAVEPLPVVPGTDQQRGGTVRADAEQGAQVGAAVAVS